MNDTSNKIKENKYKILRMSLLLGNGTDRDETISNFEEAARDIDAMNDEVYLREIDSKFYDTSTLEDEEKKLASLVDYIGGRVDQRISLINDFANVTGYGLDNLPSIKYYDRLDEYKSRLNYIREYLDNVIKIGSLNKEIDDLGKELDRACSNKERAEERNKNDEKILLDRFKNIINRVDNLKNVNLNNIDSVLADVDIRVNDSKKSLDIFEKSFATLKNAGISSDDEKEYSSYVSSARVNYYKDKEEQYLLSIYKLLSSSESEFDKIIDKRDTINNILYDRINLRKELGLRDSDIFGDIYELLEKQYENIKNQKIDIDKIDNLSNEIKNKKDAVRDLELDNQKVEILSLLREFGIIDTYDDIGNESSVEVESTESYNTSNDSDIEMPLFSNEDFSIDSTEAVIDDSNDEDNNFESDINIDDVNDVSADLFADAKDNQVVFVKNVDTANLDEIVSKANSVMKRVGKMLGIDIKESIVSVENNISNDSSDENNDNNDGINNDNISGQSFDTSMEDVKEESQSDDLISVDANNLFFNNDNDDSTNNDFWNNSFDDGGLNSLPDLPVSDNNGSDNFFNSEMPELNIDFGNNDSEGQ